ncbi:hypothetical protein SAMN05660464_1969 [Geodermatophilus dictyosporus]|uniref:Uncharacterized protein n=1 Tax=Geodermatophilus dictyosporus TaxID=1523247 RepID=A0A1I5LWW3_9ACTN|nr:hypothetical protein [Geodermatophilus dictyosporus]SFP01722.1 hypothetical protein SAMN05660464_1969 [Geodermatophilus dictyosporus]
MDLTQVIGRATGLAGGAGAALLQRLQHVRLPGVGQASATDDPERAARRWRAVTVLRDPADVDPAAGLPTPLAALGDRIEVRVTPAPGDRGTELAARYRHTPGPEEIGDLRAALREAKALLEVGEVLRVDPQPHGRRAATPQGAALEGAAKAAPREGVL